MVESIEYYADVILSSWIAIIVFVICIIPVVIILVILAKILDL
ncbi:hypothetical protein LCGC14_1198490 [marine sediment metagenome]|uniref:Uncharacterized protein n=1 Tax=marine sediment metagenome TaxID=412755 RepID=A0A0F9LM44_9ZZZZ